MLMLLVTAVTRIFVVAGTNAFLTQTMTSVANVRLRSVEWKSGEPQRSCREKSNKETNW